MSTSLPPTKPVPLSSSLTNILADLEHFNQTKWGWVMYRCAYGTAGSDEAWARFRHIVEARSARRMARPDVPPGAADALEWNFVSDRDALEGASRDQLRRRFRTWADEAAVRERRRAQPTGQEDGGGGKGDVAGGLKSQRYAYFVQVDEEALRSVVDTDPGDRRDVGWVNLVRADEEQDFGRGGGGGDGEGDGMAASEVAVDEGWMMIASDMLGPDFYDAIGQMPEYWYSFYAPPPAVVAW
ncbi:hypothetical protein NKR19_g7646 [Coniochaeta hoffmannii]|uniref:Uncharacterized protein n=1 Tax=Coniochaeta hoffmannii TaxID=91930 RepID=A0AA38VG13_9PEZI|nr:hypothetical protein NKR19_g7646 [Coniochaeta hoffmannii]